MVSSTCNLAIIGVINEKRVGLAEHTSDQVGVTQVSRFPTVTPNEASHAVTDGLTRLSTVRCKLSQELHPCPSPSRHPDPARCLITEEALSHTWITSFAAQTEHDLCTLRENFDSRTLWHNAILDAIGAARWEWLIHRRKFFQQGILELPINIVVIDFTHLIVMPERGNDVSHILFVLHI